MRLVINVVQTVAQRIVANNSLVTYIRDPKMFKKMITTEPDKDMFMLRLAIGVVLIVKLMTATIGIFGGTDLTATFDDLVNRRGMTAPFAVTFLFLYLFCSIGLLLGTLTRVAAMIVLYITPWLIFYTPIRLSIGIYSGEVYSGYNILIILSLMLLYATAILLIRYGGGWCSVDFAMSNKLGMKQACYNSNLINVSITSSMETLFRTSRSNALFLLRVIIGAALVLAILRDVTVWDGWPSFWEKRPPGMRLVHIQNGYPALINLPLILFSILLLFGFLTRVAAVVLVGAFIYSYKVYCLPFLYRVQPLYTLGDLDFLMLSTIILVGVFFLGGGNWSVDGYIFNRFVKK